MRFQISKFRIQTLFRVFCLLSFALFAACGVSIPNLEAPACLESGDAVKRFYSYHLDAGASNTPETFKAREKYLTPEFYAQLQNAANDIDPFTFSDEIPRGFRLGECEAAGDKTSVKVFLFWRNGESRPQRSIQVEAVKQNDTWLINRISEE